MAKHLTLPTLLLAILSSATAQYFQSGGTCCDLMDVDGSSLLEHLYNIGEGRVNTIYVKLCTTTPVAIQLWLPTETPEQWQLAWFKEIQIFDPALTDEWFEVAVDEFDLTADHRLGLYANRAETLSVPWDVTEGAQPLSRSVFTYYTPNWDMYSQTQAFTAVHYQRSFLNSVRFCYNSGVESACLNGNIPNVVVVAGPSGPQGPTGTPGPPGPPGPAGAPGPYCFSDLGGWDNVNPGACDITESMQESLNQIQANNDILQEKLDLLSSSVSGSNLLTGSCPAGFISGTYGLGFCYLFVEGVQLSFGEALQHCHENYGALPVIVESSLEEAFLSTNIVSLMKDAESSRMYWTAGLWSERLDEWVWYDENLESKKPMTYTNWLAGEPDRGNNGLEVCVTLNVIRDNDEGPYSYWTSEECTIWTEFVCKLPKSCY